ncbi:MAG: glycosyltransferase family A protein [Desulfitobacterium sp.]
MFFKRLVSVIIPAYNHEKFIASCIESVAAQTYANIELIIINDGSSDTTDEKIVALIEQYRKRFKKVTYINREHKGTAATLNELIYLSKGKFIFQIASDDMAKPHAIETLYTFMVRNRRYALAVGDNEIIDSDNKRVYWDQDRNNIEDISKAVYKTFVDFLQSHRPDFDFNSESFGQLPTLLIGNYIPNGKMFRKSALLKVGGYKEETLEDYYINIKLAKKYKLKYIDTPLFSYRWHENNSIKNYDYISRISTNMNEFLDAERRDLERAL